MLNYRWDWNSSSLKSDIAFLNGNGYGTKESKSQKTRNKNQESRQNSLNVAPGLKENEF